MSIKIQFTTVVLAATLAFVGGAKAAPAASLDDATVSTRVSVADLDLHQQAGIAVAHQRIRQAATFVCGSEPPYAGIYQHRLYQRCRKAAVDDAVADLGARMTALKDSPKATTLAANR
jgi:UrcA family protein